MLKKLIVALMLIVGSAIYVPADNVAHAAEVYMGNFKGTDYYIESDSIYGNREKFSVRLITADASMEIYFSSKGVMAVAIVGENLLMVNGNPLLEKIHAYCLDSGRLD